MNNEKVFILTDGCMWEINKETGNEHPHSIEVVDIEEKEKGKTMPRNKQGMPKGKGRKKTSGTNDKPIHENASV